MIEPNKLFEDAINDWRNNKGIGTAIIPNILDDKPMVLGILQRIYGRSPSAYIVVVTNSFIERQSIIEFVTQQEDSEENNNEFKKLLDSGKLKVFTDNFIISNTSYKKPLLCIWYKPDNICQEMIDYVGGCKFRLIILDRLPSNSNQLLDIYKLAPLLPSFQQIELDQFRLSTPVEETQVAIDMPADCKDTKLLKKYEEYIATSLNIFGSLDIMKQASIGNDKLNISAAQVCARIAQENGWHGHLDMSVDINVEIDKLYNPNSLSERASHTYDIIREKSKLLSDFAGKLDVILDIVKNNEDKKILIINKRAEFASHVTEFLNNLSDTIICANYHDKVDSVPAVASDGTPIYYKSGEKKGERRMLGAKAQKTLNVERFNRGYINILSANNAPDKDLLIDVDIIIITSPMCEDIKTYMYRLTKLGFRNNRLELYSLYCRNTTEQKLIERKDKAENHTIKKASDDENNYDFIVDD